MHIIHGVRNLLKPLPSSVLTIGNFDGVHLGHQALLRQVVSHARAAGIPAVVMVFEPHPVKVLYPDRGLNRIFDFEDQRVNFEAHGMDMLVVEPFSREFSQVPAERYITEWIYRPFSPREVVVGYDFSFGANRQGSIEFLRERSSLFGFGVEVIPPVKVDGTLVSSSRIRQAVVDGDVAMAARMLDRYFYVEGIVEKGAGRGRTIGIPTANLRTTAETVPRQGVYAAHAITGQGRQRAVVNIGVNPTFTSGAHPMTIEAHILDFESNLYGEEIRLEFVKRLRDEKKFSGVEELIAQIRNDIATAEKIFDERR